MMFLPSHDGGDNLETMSKMIQENMSQVKVRSENSLFQKLPEF